MKKIIREAVREESVFLDDFNGREAATEVTIDSWYGSKRDSIKYIFHFNDESLDKLMQFIKDNLPAGDLVCNHGAEEWQNGCKFEEDKPNGA